GLQVCLGDTVINGPGDRPTRSAQFGRPPFCALEAEINRHGISLAVDVDQDRSVGDVSCLLDETEALVGESEAIQRSLNDKQYCDEPTHRRVATWSAEQQELCCSTRRFSPALSEPATTYAACETCVPKRASNSAISGAGLAALNRKPCTSL